LHLTGELRSRRQRQAAPSMEKLTEIGKRCSYTERRAEDAERELRQLKVLRLLESRLGDEEPGTVTGVANIGVYVQLDKYLTDGLIRFSDMQDDWWEVDARAGRAIGTRSGQRIVIGDRVKVRIAAVDLAARELDLALIETAGRPQRQPGRSPPTGGKPRLPAAQRPPRAHRSDRGWSHRSRSRTRTAGPARGRRGRR
ncbi:MAG: S1 RNA-binding domain-containing protein, partial [Phycisphaerae bacterium]